MQRWTRWLIVVALLVGLTGMSTVAGAQTEGAYSANFEVDVVVRGTPPPGAQIVVTEPTSDPAETFW